LLARLRLAQPVRVAVAGGHLGDRGAQQLLLGGLGEVHHASSITASTSPASTWDPVVTRSSASTPSAGASTACSIFIASSASSCCPAVTRSPLATRTATTWPGIGAVSEPA